MRYVLRSPSKIKVIGTELSVLCLIQGGLRQPVSVLLDEVHIHCTPLAITLTTWGVLFHSWLSHMGKALSGLSLINVVIPLHLWKMTLTASWFFIFIQFHMNAFSDNSIQMTVNIFIVPDIIIWQRPIRAESAMGWPYCRGQHLASLGIGSNKS